MVGKRLAVLLHEETNVIEEHHVKNLKLFHSDDIGEDPRLSEEEGQPVQGLLGNDAAEPPTIQDDDSDIDQDDSVVSAPRPGRAAKERARRAIHQQACDEEDVPL
ncbi:hypothetical protein FOL47_001845 [Perkinsus chesapeaki]|uniref:Uncharacterized protein n=1 Tax=Perkinsus chesapeaki TaxID=330153 RepID=A0A7J6KT00_PERCH|nr:hypothetical protein FOL47_001845 [Perkinsus chesapeaki]